MEFVNEIKQRLELALRLEKPPTIEEVLEQASRHGVLRGPVDWVFPAWMLYVEYATQEIIKAFPLSEEEKRQLFQFQDTLTRLLRAAWTQAKEKLTTLYKAVAEGTYRVEGNKLCAPDGTWMHTRENLVPRVLIHRVGASAYFPDVLKLPREKLELFQLGWRASDEGNKGGWSEMGTTQPWQVFAWAAARYGKLYLRVGSVNLVHEGVSIMVRIKARGWRQKWSKDEAVDLVMSYFKRGEWAPLLTMWLGDGLTERKKILRGKFGIIIASKEPWRLGRNLGSRRALVASGREAFEKLRGSAGVYGELLLDLLKAHKWIDVKLATDDALRLAHKNRKRRIDVLREMYGGINGEIPTVSHTEADKPGAVAVAGIMMNLYLKGGRGGSLIARRYVHNARKALAIAERLETAGLRPNVVPVGSDYMVYIAMADLLRLAEKDDKIRKAIVQYLAEKAKNGTPRQKEIAEKILKRHPHFLTLSTILPFS